MILAPGISLALIPMTLSFLQGGAHSRRHRSDYQVEKDFTTYGEEVKFGGGKVIRDGMGQSQITNNKARSTPLSPTR